MFWWIVLPFQITLVTAIVMIAMVTLCVPRSVASKWFTCFASTCVAFVAFIPACTTIMGKLDASRFGLFHYETTSEATSYKLKYWTPQSATDIEAELRREGHRSQFSISQNDLEAWHEKVWKRDGFPEPPSASQVRDAEAVFERHFEELGWQPPVDLLSYTSPHDESGAGAVTWYSPSQERAFQNCGYW